MDLDQLLALALEHKWLPVFGLLIAAIVRLLKSDTKIPIDIPSHWRAELALGLGLFGGALEKVIAGAPWTDALSDGVTAGISAIVLHKVVDIARKGADVPVPGLMKPDVAKVGLTSIVWVVLVAFGLSACTPAQRAGIPALSTFDAIGKGVAQVMHWCDERGIDATTVATAKKAIDEKDYRSALSLLSGLVDRARAAGDPIPEEVEVTLRLSEGALAAQAIEQGMRALSKPAEPAKDAGP